MTIEDLLKEKQELNKKLSDDINGINQQIKELNDKQQVLYKEALMNNGAIEALNQLLKKE